jgi:hypothetical protein
MQPRLEQDARGGWWVLGAAGSRYFGHNESRAREVYRDMAETKTQELVRRIDELLSTAETLVDGSASALRLWTALGIDQTLAEATDDTTTYADTEITIGRLREIDKFFQAFLVFEQSPVAEGYAPPVVIISTR